MLATLLSVTVLGKAPEAPPKGVAVIEIVLKASETQNIYLYGAHGEYAWVESPAGVFTAVALNTQIEDSLTKSHKPFIFKPAGDTIRIHGNVVRMIAPKIGMRALRVQGKSYLRWLDIHANEVQELDLAECIYLERLDCHDNKIATLDLRANKKLEVLNCSANQLMELDASHLDHLQVLNCSDCPLEDLKLPHDSKLREVHLLRVNLSKRKVNSILKILPQMRAAQKGLLVLSNPGEKVTYKVKRAVQKSWVVQMEGENPLR